jgi:hypothetical protein
MHIENLCVDTYQIVLVVAHVRTMWPKGGELDLSAEVGIPGFTGGWDGKVSGCT